ncbi:DUF421 domain-containing protein [Pontibacter fetidus]|uniref:DUF421 domain-containing protein n=1 Tax=Pontibacter fetidus TaxID=2700082 RepID=A0A6B2H332_9BACT|nr:YetF domain-containing protein [Pontibacter fetidus]NDK56801.1 DUF421 domain-containing protein [Pontibacter fetidus]
MEQFLFDSWTSLFRTLSIGLLSYGVLVLQLRISGKRTLSKMNAFDFVVTIALGSTLATMLLSKDVTLADGTTAFALLILLQYIITWLSVRSENIQHLMKAQPALLLYKGQFMEQYMKRERITKEEILAAIRSQGIGNIEKVDAVVLETQGNLSVIQKIEDGSGSVLQNVKPNQL